MKSVARLTLIGMVLIFSSLAAYPVLAEQPGARSILQSPIDTPIPSPTPYVATPTPGGTVTPVPTAVGTLIPSPTPYVATPTPGGTVTPPGSLPILGNHTIKYGESLFCIGRAYAVSPWAIAQVNSITWPYPIFPNQVLKIPNSPWLNPPYGPVCQRQFGSTPPPAVTPGPLPTPAPTVNPPGCRATYVVVWGDTLYRIALRFNSNIYVIAQANHIWNINLIYPGQRLCIS